jgi:hypothetical protein
MNGTLGKAMSVAAQFVTVYTVPTAGVDFATISVFMVNTGPAAANVRFAISTEAATPLPQDYIEHGAIIPANGGVLERTCIPVSAGDKVMVFSDVATVAIRVAGLEQPLNA